MVSLEVLRVWNGHGDGQVLALSWSPAGRIVASAGNPDIGECAAPEVLLWDVRSGKRIAAFGGADSAIHREGGPPELHPVVAFSPGGKWLGLVDDEGIRLCAPKTGREVRRLEANVSGPMIALVFTDGDNAVLAGSGRGLFRRWDVPTGRCTFELDLDTSGIQRMAFSPRADFVAFTWVNGLVHFWKLETRQHLALLRGHGRTCSCLRFSPDGRRLASTGEDGKVIVWSVDTLRPEAEADLGGRPEERPWGAGFAPDGASLAVGFGDGSVRALDAATLRELSRLQVFGEEEPVCELAFSPDGDTLAAGSLDGALAVIAVSRGRGAGPAGR